jgi:uncharacterized integral membrane protein
MKLRLIVLVVVLGLLSVFIFANWAAITAPTQVSLVVKQIEAPLGLILLVCLAVVVALFLFAMVFQQAGLLRETRRYAKELAAQRALADEAEASRFTELRTHLDARLDRLDPGGSGMDEPLNERIDRLEAAMRAHIDHAGNSLAAYIGEVDDRVERLLGSNPPPRN